MAERDFRAKAFTVKVGVVTCLIYPYMQFHLFTDIKLDTQGKHKHIWYYIQIFIDDIDQSINKVKEKNNSTSWDKTFYVWIHLDCSTSIQLNWLWLVMGTIALPFLQQCTRRTMFSWSKMKSLEDSQVPPVEYYQSCRMVVQRYCVWWCFTDAILSDFQDAWCAFGGVLLLCLKVWELGSTLHLLLSYMKP